MRCSEFMNSNQILSDFVHKGHVVAHNSSISTLNETTAHKHSVFDRIFNPMSKFYIC